MMCDFPPLYQFPKYWQRKIYKFGIETSIRELDEDPKVWDVMNYGMFREDEDRVVEWRPRCAHLSDTAVFRGYILFVKEEIAKGKKIEGSTEQFCFRPTVEVCVDLNGGKRLLASRISGIEIREMELHLQIFHLFSFSFDSYLPHSAPSDQRPSALLLWFTYSTISLICDRRSPLCKLRSRS